MNIPPLKLLVAHWWLPVWRGTARAGKWCPSPSPRPLPTKLGWRPKKSWRRLTKH